MSGFFFAAAIVLWTVLFDRERSTVRWRQWFFGSVLGALPLIPWALYALEHPFGQSMSAGWDEILQFKFWAFWFTDPLGLHLGNPLGLLRGLSNWEQISDFVRYPVIYGQATYLCGLAHLALVGCAGAILIRFLLRLDWKNQGRSSWIGRSSDTAFLQSAGFFGCGILLTLTGVVIRRYYMAVTFPLEFLFWIRMAKPETRWGHRLLFCLWFAELVVSANFVGYVHVNEGAPLGDYGKAYHRIISEVKH
jgi:4-amino-4-deoxy-L-arabinose transferase-like glycosyltransferase